MTSSSVSAQVRASNVLGRLCIIAALSLSAFLPPQFAAAQEEANIGVLVVDMQRIRRDAAAAVSVRRQINELRSELEIIIAQRSKAISAEEAALAEERVRLTADELRARVREFEKKVFANRDFAQQEAAKLQALQAQAQASLRRNIAPILALIMQERDAKLMLDKSQVVLSADSLEVTDEVLERLDSVMPTLVLAPLRPVE